MANTLKLGAGKWATGKDTVLSFNDENGNFKPMPFSFSRASNATVVNQSGLIEIVGSGTPRIDFLGNTKGALLLEPSRTNLETKSNGFSTWSLNNNITKTADYIISPDGTQNATRLQFTANGYVANLPQSLATYTMSCYAKRNDSGTQNVGFFTNGSGVVNSAWAVTSEWKRFSYTFPALNASFMGIAGVSGADISVYGFQIEGLVSYPTSYIPTSGSAVTRVADACSQTVPDGVIGQTEGVVYIDFIAQNSTGQSQSHFWLGATGSEIGLYGGSQFVFYSSGGVQISSANIVTGQRYKIAFGYKANDYVAYINGTQVGTDTSATVPTMSGLSLGSYFNGNEVQKKNINDFKLYNTRLSNAEIAALTTI